MPSVYVQAYVGVYSEIRNVCYSECLCVSVFRLGEQRNPFSPQWYGETLLSWRVSHTQTHTHTHNHAHTHRDTLRHTSGCHAVLHGAVITLSSAGPYTLIHLYSILC